MSLTTIYTNPANVDLIFSTMRDDPRWVGDLRLIETVDLPAECDCCGKPLVYMPCDIPLLPGEIYEWDPKKN